MRPESGGSVGGPVPAMTFRRDACKRAADIVGAGAALVVLSPVLLAIAIAVRLCLGSPVLFRQERPGRHGEPFELLKFRSMLSGAGRDAERLTPFGRRLRSTSLDELPELLNVLRGDMSLVGPRPLLKQYLPLYNERQRRRHDVRPGLTGLAQVSGRNLSTWEERFELDVRYVETWSVWLDVRIMAKTLGPLVRRTGVSAVDHPTMYPFEGSGVSGG